MRLKETLIIGVMALLSLSMMHSESTRVTATEPARPDAEATAAVTEAEIASLLAMVQESAAPVPPKGVSHTAPRRPDAGRAMSVTPEFVDQCMEVAEEINPEWAARMRGVCERTPEEFERFIRQSGRRLAALVDLKQRDPKLYETKINELRIEAQISDLVHKLRKLNADGRMDSPEAGELKSELYALVQQQVAFSLKARGDYINRLHEHVDALEKQLEKDALGFFRTVEERYTTLIDMP